MDNTQALKQINQGFEWEANYGKVIEDIKWASTLAQETGNELHDRRFSINRLFVDVSCLDDGEYDGNIMHPFIPHRIKYPDRLLGFSDTDYEW